MSIASRLSLTQASNRRHRGGTGAKVLAVAVVAWLASPGGHAQGPTVSKTGSVDGLEAKFVDIKGVKTRYYEAGQREPLVLVHGGGFAGYYSANVWSKNIPGLSKRFHVFAPDKLAAGLTDNPPGDKDYNLQGEAEHIYQFIQAMKLGKVHLVGQSRGAGLALFLAMRHPAVVKTLILVNSGTAAPRVGNSNPHAELMARCPQDPDESWKCEMRMLSFKGEVAFPDEYFAPAVYMGNLPKSKATIAKIAAGAGEPLRTEWNKWKNRMHERLQAEAVLPMPVLLYWAENDPQAPASKYGVPLYGVLAVQHPNARLLTVNKAGHFHFREYPDEFNHNVTSFIDYWNRQPTETAAAARGPAQGQPVSKTGAIAGLEPKFVDVKALGGTIKTRYYDEGQGEPVVLVHGGGMASFNANSANMWSRNLPGLSQRFRVLAVDKLAAGMTDNPPNDKDYSIAGEVEHMHQFIQALKLGQVHLVGQSRGAGLALLLATKHPKVVKTLVLVNSQTAAPDEGVGRATRASMMWPCSEGDRTWRMRCEMEVLSFRPKVSSTWEDEYYAAGVYMGGLPKAEAARVKIAAGAGGPDTNGFVDGVAYGEYKKRLHQRLRNEAVLPMPVLLYWGYNDPQATRERALALFEILAARHPNVRMLWVNKAGHFHYREYPEEFNHNLITFIDYWNRQPAATTAKTVQ